MIAVLLSQWARLALQLLPGPLNAYGHIDLASLLVRENVTLTHWPYWAFPFEYHPVIAWGTALLSYIAPHLVFIVFAWGLVVAAAAGAVAYLLLPVVGARRTIIFWSLSPQLLLFGGANFDALAVLCMVAAATLFAAARPRHSGVAIGLGAATKVFPIVAVAPFAISLWRARARHSGLAIVAAAAVTIALLDGPAVIAPYSLLQVGVTPYQVASWNLDSIWLPVALVLGFVLEPESIDRLIVLISGAGMLTTYVLAMRSVWRSGDAVRCAWIAVAIVLVWTRLYSPQYAIWLLPLFVLYVPRPSLLGFMFIGDALAFFTIFGLRAVGRDLGDPAVTPLLAAMIVGVIIRHVALLRLLYLAWRRPVRRSDDPTPSPSGSGGSLLRRSLPFLHAADEDTVARFNGPKLRARVGARHGRTQQLIVRWHLLQNDYPQDAARP